MRRTEAAFEKWWKKWVRQRRKFHKQDVTYTDETVGEYHAAKFAWFAVDFDSGSYIYPFKIPKRRKK